jgi:hypothetical protein
MHQNMSFGSNGVDRARSLLKDSTQLRLANLCVMVPVRPVWHRVSCSKKKVRNVLKHEFWVKWSGSGAFVVKNVGTTSFSELVH